MMKNDEGDDKNDEGDDKKVKEECLFIDGREGREERNFQTH